MGDWFSSGKKKTKEEPTPDPQTQALNALRLKLAQGIASGDWSGMQGFFDKVLVPTTMGSATAAGLGRSGAVTEAVAHAQLSYGTDFLKALLAGVPSSPGGGTTTSQYQPGPVDWLQMLLQFGGMAAKK